MTFNNISNKIVIVIQKVLFETQKNTKGGARVKKPVWAIKLKRFCEDNRISAQEVSTAIGKTRATVYKYWSGDIPVPDETKKVLEKKLGLPIYETFYNEEL